MKFFANLLVVSGAGVFGYFAEPSLRLELTGLSPTARPPQPEPGNQEEAHLSQVDVTRYAPEQLPKEVTLKKEAQVTDSSSGLKLTVPAGNKVKLIRLGTGTLIVGTGAPNIEGEVEVHDTDVREQLISVVPAPPSAEAGDAMAKNDPAMGGAAPENGDETAMNDGSPGDGSNPALTPDQPTDGADAAAGEFSAMEADDIVKTMQDSLKAAEVKDIKFDQVSEWAGGEPEEMEGKKYNTGTVSYKAQTILGLKPRQAKAYIAGGKVVRWVNPRSGTDIN